MKVKKIEVITLLFIYVSSKWSSAKRNWIGTTDISAVAKIKIY